MGIANRKLQIANEKVVFDFGATGVFVARGDRRALTTEDDLAGVLRQAAGMLAKVAGGAELRQPLMKIAADHALANEGATINYSARAVKYLIRAAVQTAITDPKKARKKDRIIYSAWLPAIDYEAPDEATITVEHLDWLREVLDKLLGADDGDAPALPMEMSQWLVAAIDYAHDLYERTLASLASPETHADAAAPGE